MNLGDLERELARFRTGEGAGGDDVAPLSVEEALAYRNAGNLPDERGRTLRLVLRVESEADLADLEMKRLSFEPDYLDPPEWRRAGSKPVNVVPLRAPEVKGDPRAWWDDPDLGLLEGEWQRTGAIDGLRIPGEYRSFVFKTILALRRSGKERTPDSIADGTARWLSPAQVEEIRRALTLN